MIGTPAPDAPRPDRVVRDLADDHVRRVAAQNPIVAVELGVTEGRGELPDLSPDGLAAEDDLRRDTLRRLAELPTPTDHDDRRCARLLTERLTAQLAHSESGEPLRAVQELFGPLAAIRNVFTLMPLGSEDDWAAVAARMARVPAALEGHRRSLAEGRRRGLLAAPRQVERVAEQLRSWIDTEGRGWFATFCADADVSSGVRADLDRGAVAATEALASMRQGLAEEYLPATTGTPDGVGAERYRIAARYWNGADVDPGEVYAWGWSEFRRLLAESAVEADRVLPGATVAEAIAHLDAGGGTSGVLANGEETPPALDFSRPGCTWLPAAPDDRYPLWGLLTMWYHEGVPGHHLQLATWVRRSAELSLFQTSLVGAVGADVEGWALYAERLMDELGYHADPGSRLGYLNAQMLRAVRVVIDLGMHLSLRVPDDSPVGAGQRWTPELGREFFGRHVGVSAAMADSELLRYLGGPGQAISYKLGERAWLTGRERARARQGSSFDLRAWHAAALAQGTLGLDDLVGELAELPRH